MEFYKGKSKQTIIPNTTENLITIHTFTSIYIPVTKWLLDFAGKSSIEKQVFYFCFVLKIWYLMVEMPSGMMSSAL